MAVVSRGGASVVAAPGQLNSVTPVLQPEDGSFVGTAWTGPWEGSQHMIAFDAGGNLRWSVAGYTPQIATADGGVIATTDSGSAVTFDSTGAATGQMGSLLTQSWRGNVYQQGSVERLLSALIRMAITLWANAGGNPSSNHSAARPWYCKLVWENNCSGWPWPCGFPLYPDNPQVIEAMAVDASSQAPLIKSSALVS